MVQALVIGLLVCSAAAALSSLLVLKGWSLMGDAVSHAVLPGIVIAYLLNLPFLLGAFVTGMLCAVSTGYISDNSRLKEDTVMDQVLFGDMLGVSWADIGLTASLTLPALFLVLFFRRDLLLFAFDPQHARVVGLNVKLMHYGLLAILSLVIVAAIKAVGIILVIAVLIAPGAIAFLLTDRFEHMLWWAIGVAMTSTLLGIVLSYHIDSAPAPTIVVLLTAAFIVVFLFAPRRGIARAAIQ